MYVTLAEKSSIPKKVVGKGMVEGLSHRALRWKFAVSLPISMIHDIQARYETLRDSTQQKQSYYINPFNKQLLCDYSAWKEINSPTMVNFWIKF